MTADAEDHAVRTEGRIVDPGLVRDERVGPAAEIDELVPVNVVASESRHLETGDDAGFASPEALIADPYNQVTGFLGGGLPPAAQLWSKAGLTSKVRHDAAYLELPSGRKLILVLFTRGTADDVKLLPAITVKVLHELKEGPAAPPAAPSN